MRQVAQTNKRINETTNAVAFILTASYTMCWAVKMLGEIFIFNEILKTAGQQRKTKQITSPRSRVSSSAQVDFKFFKGSFCLKHAGRY